ncbi:MAG: hypothetical protein E5V96_30165, partial [Mesorhizobium sp.]
GRTCRRPWPGRRCSASRSKARDWGRGRRLADLPLVGEMSDRTEGGAVPPAYQPTAAALTAFMMTSDYLCQRAAFSQFIVIVSIGWKVGSACGRISTAAP